jgi:hypothetical protein
VTYRLRPSTKHEANAFITAHHRHHGQVRGLLFALAAETDAGELVGVIVVGRPVARLLQDGRTAEVTRSCVLEGHPNVASMLLGRARRAAGALCYDRLVTYTQYPEPGTTLQATGWTAANVRRRASWTTPSRPRGDAPSALRTRWETPTSTRRTA